MLMQAEATIQIIYTSEYQQVFFVNLILLLQADDTIQMIIYDNEYQQGASRGTVNAMAADNTQNWTLTLLNGDVSYARSAVPSQTSGWNSQSTHNTTEHQLLHIYNLMSFMGCAQDDLICLPNIM